jgi:hypothetical protein
MTIAKGVEGLYIGYLYEAVAFGTAGVENGPGAKGPPRPDQVMPGKTARAAHNVLRVG